jgi:23S rRNA (cytidine1920-2'-O)/16S rRNA (cytidine1409-2'-O)-methyltransferase
MRLDSALVARGLCSSRTAAQKAIEDQRVKLRRLGEAKASTAQKASLAINDQDEILIENTDLDEFASRGALKLAGALDSCGLNVGGMVCLDVGQSTGGFTDVLLKQGAAKVLGLEVGHGQLHERLRRDPRTLCLEGFNARQCSHTQISQRLSQAGHCIKDWLPEGGFDLIVMDVSFISLLKISASLKALIRPGASGLWLVKPQFEVGPSLIGKGGIVKPEALGDVFETSICRSLQDQGFNIKRFLPSPIAGGDGNVEYFVWVVPES